MGWFSNKKLSDEVFELEWEKQNTSWDQRLGRHTWAIIGAALFFFFILAMVGISNNHDKNLSWGRVKPGDTLYPPEEFITDSANRNFFFCRMIRPITSADIDTMRISVAEKTKMIAQLDTNLKDSIMIQRSEIVIPRDSMYKYGTAAIGDFVSKDSTIATSENGVSEYWYEVIPNKQLVYEKYILSVPKGYILANHKYYVEPFEVRLEEPAIMKKYKPKITNAGVIHKLTTDRKATKNTTHINTRKSGKRRKHKLIVVRKS